MTIAAGLLHFRDQFGAPFHLLMASSVMAVVPIVVIFSYLTLLHHEYHHDRTREG